MSRWVKFLIAIALGLSLGLVYGWVLSPVEYVDTSPDTLRADFRADYVLMAAETFAAAPDLDLAARRLALLGSDHPAEITARALEFARQRGYSEPDLALLQDLAAALQTWQPPAGGQP